MKGKSVLQEIMGFLRILKQLFSLKTGLALWSATDGEVKLGRHNLLRGTVILILENAKIVLDALENGQYLI